MESILLWAGLWTAHAFCIRSYSRFVLAVKLSPAGAVACQGNPIGPSLAVGDKRYSQADLAEQLGTASIVGR
jgi:hypothetical protein